MTHITRFLLYEMMLDGLLEYRVAENIRMLDS